MLYFETLESTNDYIKEHLDEIDNFEMVYTSNQTKGKGRTGHTWEVQPNKNATFSILVKDDKIVNNFNLVSIVTGLVIADYLEMMGIPNVKIKWPNDIYVGDKKICGILLEGNVPNYLIIGVGINVSQTNFEGFSATSIKNILGIKIDQKLVAIDVADALKSELKYMGDDLSDYIDSYNEKDYLLNKTISFVYNNENMQGIASGINLDGSLKVNVDGKLINVTANEVNLVRKT